MAGRNTLRLARKRNLPDLFEVLPHADQYDIPLSTAATLSARFPLISPYGALPGDDPKRPSERLVDGGYFENDGVTTAFEISTRSKPCSATSSCGLWS